MLEDMRYGRLDRDAVADLARTVAEREISEAKGVEAVQRVDFSRRIEGGPVDHGFDTFFGTACCPTTDWLYAFIEGDAPARAANARMSSLVKAPPFSGNKS